MVNRVVILQGVTEEHLPMPWAGSQLQGVGNRIRPTRGLTILCSAARARKENTFFWLCMCFECRKEAQNRITLRPRTRITFAALSAITVSNVMGIDSLESAGR